MKFVDGSGTEYRPTSWLAFNDVLLKPQRSKFSSRNDPNIDLGVGLGTNINLRIPIISANMDTVTSAVMATEMHKLGGLGILHRFHKNEYEYLQAIQYVFNHCNRNVAFSVGCGKDWIKFVNDVVEKLNPTFDKPLMVCLDVAHGHMEQAVETVRELRKLIHIFIIAGNVATGEAAVDLAEAGADCIKVGVGCGSVCTTRIVTGHGVPQLSAIMECREALGNAHWKVGIIADGGIKTSGDIMKAIAAGADAVMIGNMLAGCDETPGAAIKTSHGTFKLYRGQSSRHFLNDIGKIGVASEGESIEIPSKGSTKSVIDELVGGIRSGLTYSGAGSIYEFKEKAVFVEISHHGWVESTPHALNKA